MRVVVVLATGLFLLLATACGNGAGHPDEPPRIRLGEDVCDQCHMIISDERFASAYRTVDGTVRRFDDIGDMATYHAIYMEDVANFWVHDFETLDWIKSDMAWFVLSNEVMSPMGHGLAAYDSANRADTAAAVANGQVLRWEQVLAMGDDGH